MKGTNPPEKIKESTIHKIIKDLSPKRTVKSTKKGPRVISRSITPDALSYLTSYLNIQLESIVEVIEQALNEINNNPNSYYQQHRYNLQVVKLAIKMLEDGDLYE